MKNYGITSVGKHTVVCLVLNASSVDVKYLEKKFPDLIITTYLPEGYSGKHYSERVRIEGCVLNRDNFHLHYRYAKASMASAKANEELDLLNELLYIDGLNAMRCNLNGKEILIDTTDIM